MKVFMKNLNFLFAMALTVSLTSISAQAQTDDSDDGGVCDIEVADIIVDLEVAKAQGPDRGSELFSVTGSIGLQALVSNGLRLTPLNDIKKETSTINLVLNPGEGSFILDTEGNVYPLVVTDSQAKKGIKIRTDAKVELLTDGTYRLKLLEFPSLKLDDSGGCRLQNNLRGSLAVEASNSP